MAQSAPNPLLRLPNEPPGLAEGWRIERDGLLSRSGPISGMTSQVRVRRAGSLKC
jgi:hypothetical protein